MKKLLLAALACTLVTACGKDRNNDPIKNVQEAAKDKDLQGKNFASACQLKPVEAVLTGILSGGNASIKGAQTVYRFDGANVTRTTELYSTTDCSGEVAIRFEEGGTVTLDPDKRTNDDGKFIDIDYNSLKVSAVTDEGVKAANAIQLCGATDWSQGTQRDEVAQAPNINCYNAKLPRQISNVYRVDANVLYFGTQDTASIDSAHRPTSLDMNDKYTEK